MHTDTIHYKNRIDYYILQHKSKFYNSIWLPEEFKKGGEFLKSQLRFMYLLRCNSTIILPDVNSNVMEVLLGIKHELDKFYFPRFTIVA